MAILERASWPEMHRPVPLTISALNSGQALKEAWQLVGNRSSERRGGQQKGGVGALEKNRSKERTKSGRQMV